MTTPTPSLAEFFETMKTFLARGISADAVIERLGPTPSAPSRVHLYQHLVLADIAKLLEGLYPALKNAANRHRLGFWDQIVVEYFNHYRPTVWHYHESGGRMCELIANFRKTHPNMPAYFEELADFQWTKILAHDAPPADGDDVIDKTVFVRQYTHSITHFCGEVVENAEAPLPIEKPTLVLVYRSYATERPRIFYASLPSLLALAKRTGTAAEMREKFASTVSEELIAQGERELIEHSVLRPRAPSPG